MLVGERYNNSNDAYQQLHNTYVELDGELCHLALVEGWNFHVKSVIEDDYGKRVWGIAKTKNIKDCNLNLEPIKLGYMNSGSTAVYVQRKPLRKWKQGIYTEYLEIGGVKDEAVNGVVKRRVVRNDVIHRCFTGEPIIKLFDNAYPSFARAYTQVSLLRYHSAAFHRDWAFARLPVDPETRESCIALEYKGKPVGEVIAGNTVIYNQFKYLTEAFVEAMIHAS